MTGANDGLGFITTQVLHKKGCKVYLACRREEAAHQAIQKINQAHPGHEDKLVFVPFDLTELPTIRKTADTLLREEERLDIVVCNAGIMAWPYEVKNGVEVQFVRFIRASPPRSFAHYLPAVESPRPLRPRTAPPA